MVARRQHAVAAQNEQAWISTFSSIRSLTAIFTRYFKNPHDSSHHASFRSVLSRALGDSWAALQAVHNGSLLLAGLCGYVESRWGYTHTYSHISCWRDLVPHSYQTSSRVEITRLIGEDADAMSWGLSRQTYAFLAELSLPDEAREKLGCKTHTVIYTHTLTRTHTFGPWYSPTSIDCPSFHSGGTRACFLRPRFWRIRRAIRCC